MVHQPLPDLVRMVEFHPIVAQTEDKVQTVLFRPGQLQDQLPLPDVQTVECLLSVVLMAEVVQTVLCHPDQRQVQQLQQDVPMEVFHHTAVLMVVRDQTVLYQLDHRQDQLKATSIYLPVQMEELGQHVKRDRLGRHRLLHGHQHLLLVVPMVVFPLTVVQMADKGRTV